MKKIYFFLLIFSSLCASAQSQSEAEALMDQGNYDEALQMLDYLIASRPKNPGRLNMLAAECAENMQEPDARKNYLEKATKQGVADAYLQLGGMAMRDYEFATARAHYAKYVSLMTKAGKEIPSEATRQAAQADLALDMLERAELLTVLDCVPALYDEWINNILLSPEAGQIENENEALIYTTPDKRLRFSLGQGPEGNTILEQACLLSGEYSEPELTVDTTLNARNPFMLTDGCTFYFASDTPEGLGGFDIYRSNRDSETGEYLAPVNMGMPYNSPFNDYFLAIDEYSNLGWLVSDRDSEPGWVNIYIFVPNEQRRPIHESMDTEGRIVLATLSDINETRDCEEDTSTSVSALAKLRQKQSEKDVKPTKPALSFTMPDGRIVTDFPDEETRRLASSVAANQAALDRAEIELADLRRQYGLRPTPGLADKIIKAEEEILLTERTLRQHKGRLIYLLEP